MIVGEGGVSQAGSVDALARSLGCLMRGRFNIGFPMFCVAAAAPVARRCWPRSAALVSGHEVGCRSPARLLLVIHVSQGKTVCVLHDEAGVVVVLEVQGTGKRRGGVIKTSQCDFSAGR
jgi:hypothetical protein